MILVTGATGSIGRDLIGHLRQAHVPFRALVRSEGKGRELGCDFAVGDFDDPDSVAAALRGVDQLFLNAGGAVPTDGDQPMIRQQQTAIDAAAAAGTSRVVKISVWGAAERGRLAQSAHWQIEQHLKASGLAWSILQPSGFMQNFLTGIASFTADGKLIDAYEGAAISYIDCHDIAACAATLLTGPGRPGESFILTGPESLTGADIAGRFSAALGRQIGYVAMSPAEMAAALRGQGLPERFADDVAALAGGVADGNLAATTTAVRELTGRDPRTFREFLTANREAVAAAFRDIGL